MRSTDSKSLLALMSGAVTVAAHGHVNDIIIDGVQWPGFDSSKDPYISPAPTVVGWTTTATDNGFVDKSTFGSADIICHKSATNAKGHAVVAAGDQINLAWDTWPESHKGPVIDYMASCGTSSCETVDKTTLKWFKIDELGLIDGTAVPGTWASDTLISNKDSWMVKIPAAIAPGNYVLRHEIIALHSTNQPQNYPQCFNLQVTGSGTDVPDGVLGTELYKATDPGMTVNIYQTLSTYEIPGPTMYSGGGTVSQTTSAATATSSALTGSGTAAAAGTAAATSAAAAATSASTSAVKAAAVASSTASASSAAKTGAASKCKRSSNLKRRHARDSRLAEE